MQVTLQKGVHTYRVNTPKDATNTSCPHVGGHAGQTREQLDINGNASNRAPIKYGKAKIETPISCVLSKEHKLDRVHRLRELVSGEIWTEVQGYADT